MDASGSPELIGLFLVERKRPFRLNLDRLVQSHAVLGHSCDLELIICLFIAVEEHSLAILHQPASFLLRHVSPPAVRQQDLAVVGRKTSVQEVGLDAGAVEIALPKEKLICSFIVTCKDGHAPKRVHLESSLVAHAGYPVEVVSRFQKGGAVLLDLIILLLLL